MRDVLGAAWSWLSPVPTASTCAAWARPSNAAPPRIVAHRRGLRTPAGSRVRAAAAAAASTSRDGTPARAASRRQSSNSGCAPRISPSSAAELDAHRAVRRGDATNERASTAPLERAPPHAQRRRVQRRRRARRPTAPRAARAPRSRTAGRPFFMKMGADQTSTAPAAKSASKSGADELGAHVVEVGLDERTTSPARRRLERAERRADDHAQHVGAIGELARAGAVADAREAHGRQRTEARRRRRRRSRRRWASSARLALGEDRDVGAGQERRRRRRRHGHRAVRRARRRPVPTTGGSDPIEAGASQAIAAATPTTSAIES